METKNIMIVGVGGQGTLLTSRILGGIIKAGGFDVKLSEVHGMAQRGGSVVTFVRYGEKVYEPIVEEGQADVLIAFEKLEAMRYAHFLKKDGVMIVNDQRMDPMTVVTGVAEYPENILLPQAGRRGKTTGGWRSASGWRRGDQAPARKAWKMSCIKSVTPLWHTRIWTALTATSLKRCATSLRRNGCWTKSKKRPASSNSSRAWAAR